MKRFATFLLACMLLSACGYAFAQSEQDPYTLRLYYNPDGGQYIHADANCTSVSAKFLPLQPLPDELLARMKAPCPYCAEIMAPIFSASGSENMPNLQADVYQTTLSVPEWEDNRVYRIHITDKDDPARAFTDLLFPSMEGVDGLAPLLRFEDMNFDGYPDLKTLRSQGASNESSTYFLYNPTDGQFHHEPAFRTLSNYTLYPEHKLISSYLHDSASTGVHSLYRVGEDGLPMLFREASVLYDERSNWEKIRVTVVSYDPAGAETILLDEVWERFTDDADFQACAQKWEGLFYEGLPEDVR